MTVNVFVSVRRHAYASDLAVFVDALKWLYASIRPLPLPSFSSAAIRLVYNRNLLFISRLQDIKVGSTLTSCSLAMVQVLKRDDCESPAFASRIHLLLLSNLRNYILRLRY